jgi:hypothetical protein
MAEFARAEERADRHNQPPDLASARQRGVQAAARRWLGEYLEMLTEADARNGQGHLI